MTAYYIHSTHRTEDFLRIRASSLTDPDCSSGPPLWFIPNRMERIVHVSIRIHQSR